MVARIIGINGFRRGFTLLELIVVISIVGILVSLLVAAVQHTRSLARLTQCRHHLGQIGLAIHSYETTHRLLPAGSSNGLSAHVCLLPHLERSDLYRMVNFSDLNDPSTQSLRTKRVNVFECPEDEACGLLPSLAGTNYAANFGNGVLAFGYNGAFRPFQGMKLADFRGGLTTSVAMAEILMGNGVFEAHRAILSTPSPPFTGPNSLPAFSDACKALPIAAPGDEVFHGRPWTYGDPGHTWYNHVHTPFGHSCFNAGLVQEGIYSAASNHHRVVNVLFVGGNVSAINGSVSLTIWRNFGSRD